MAGDGSMVTQHRTAPNFPSTLDWAHPSGSVPLCLAGGVDAEHSGQGRNRLESESSALSGVIS